jgi:hypothetical protein
VPGSALADVPRVPAERPQLDRRMEPLFARALAGLLRHTYGPAMPFARRGVQCEVRLAVSSAREPTPTFAKIVFTWLRTV